MKNRNKKTNLKTVWRDDIIELLNNRPRLIQYSDIQKATGLKKEWLSVFARGKIVSPSVNAMNTLHDYLVSQINNSNDKSI